MLSLYDEFSRSISPLNGSASDTGQLWVRAIGTETTNKISTDSFGNIAPFNGLVTASPSSVGQPVNGVYYINQLGSAYDGDFIFEDNVIVGTNFPLSGSNNLKKAKSYLLAHVTADGNTRYEVDYDYLTEKVYLYAYVAGVQYTLSVGNVSSPRNTNNSDSYSYTVKLRIRGNNKKVYLLRSGKDVSAQLVIDHTEVVNKVSSVGYIGLRFAFSPFSNGDTVYSIGQAVYCVFDPITFASYGFVSGSYLDGPSRVEAIGATIEGGVPPYRFVWSRTPSFGFNQSANQQTTSNSYFYLQDLNVDPAANYTYEQKVTDKWGTELVLGSFDVVIPFAALQTKTLRMKAKLISAPLDDDGLQNLDTNFGSIPTNPLEPLVMPGRGDIITHNDGSLITIYSQQVPDVSTQMGLYFRRSLDKGVTWSDAVQITDSSWDTVPSLVLLDDTEDSQIGVVFNRAPFFGSTSRQIYRLVVDKQGVREGGIDPIQPDTPGLAELKSSLSVFRKPDGIVITALYARSTPNIFGDGSEGRVDMLWYENNIGFLTNNWTVQSTLGQTISFWIDKLTASFSGTNFSSHLPTITASSTIRLSNGHIACGAVIQSYTNRENSTMSWMKHDLIVLFSDDEGLTWSEGQRLTANNSATFNLDNSIGISDIDLLEMSDGKIMVFLTESAEYKFISGYSSPFADPFAGAVDVNSTGFNHATYMPTKKWLLAGTAGNGMFLVKTTEELVYKFSVDTPVTLWGRQVRDISFSTDERYIAIAHSTGLEVIDTESNADPNFWTNYQFRSSTIPALRQSACYSVAWSDDKRLHVRYGASSGVAGIVGATLDFNYDTTDPEFLSDLTLESGNNGGLSNSVPSTVELRPISFEMRREPVGGGDPISQTVKFVYTMVQGRLCLINVDGIADSVSINTSPAGTSEARVHYDDINQEFIVIYTTGSYIFKRVKVQVIPDSGDSSVDVLQLTSVLDLPWDNVKIPPYTVNGSLTIPGAGILFLRRESQQSHSYWMYQFFEQQFVGVINHAMDFYPDFPLPISGLSNGIFYAMTTTDGNWIINPSQTIVRLVPLNYGSYVKYGKFEYDSTNMELINVPFDESQIVLTPLSNINKLGEDAKFIRYPRFTRDDDDVMYYYALFGRLNRRGRNFASLVGRVEPDAYKLLMKAHILGHPTRTVDMRSRMASTVTSSIDIKAHIVFAQCIKLMARITPRTNKTISLGASILGLRSSRASLNFLVQRLQETRIRLQFYSATGYNTTATLTAKAKIVVQKSSRVSTSFMVPVDYSTSFNSIQVVVNSITRQSLYMRSRISAYSPVQSPEERISRLKVRGRIL